MKALEPVHFATLHSYLRAANLRVGLLLNFQAAMLQIKRTLNSRVHVSAIPCFSEKETEDSAPAQTSGRQARTSMSCNLGILSP